MTINVRGLSLELNDTVNRLLEFLKAKEMTNSRRRKYYDGKKYVHQVGNMIPPQYYRLAIVLGWSAKAVDLLSRRCNLDGFEWADGNLDQLGSDELWDQNMFGAEMDSATIESLIHGVSFLINTRGAAGEPPALIHVKNAQNATGDWNPRTRRMDNLLSVLRRGDHDGKTDEPVELALYLDGLTIQMAYGGQGWAVTDATPHAWGIPVEALVYKPRTSRPFGASRISRAVMSLHDAALRTLIRMEGHADFYSMPEFWLLGADEALFRNADGTMKTPWQIALGRIKAIPDNENADPQNARADVRQFQAASPIPHIEFLKIQAQQFSAETSIPVTSLGLTELVNPTSADAYVASREDLIAEAEGATDSWSPPIQRCWARALCQAEGRPLDDRLLSIKASWRSPLYLSRAAEADAGAKILSVAPELIGTTVGYKLLGLDDPQIKSVQAELEARRARDARNQVEAEPQAAGDVRGAASGGAQQEVGRTNQ